MQDGWLLGQGVWSVISGCGMQYQYRQAGLQDFSLSRLHNTFTFAPQPLPPLIAQQLKTATRMLLPQLFSFGEPNSGILAVCD